MKKLSARLNLLIFAALFTFLFYNQGLGINVVLFEFAMILFIYNRKLIQTVVQKTLVAALLLNGFMSIVNHANWTYFVNIVLLILVFGSIAAPELRHSYFILGNAIHSIFKSQITWMKELFQSKAGNVNPKYRWKALKYLVFPSFILIIFVVIYSLSNPKFGAHLSWFFTRIYAGLSDIVSMINFELFLMFIIGLVFSAMFLFQTKNELIINREKKHNDVLERKRNNGSKGSFLNAYRSAVFLFLGLNVVLFFLNCMDIYWVWFNFKWEGQFLKDFVHQGTYMLILSILLSIGLVMYYFRGSINFYTKNKLLKYLAYIWIAQNAVLVVSVFIRNSYYISFYALAYKRIAIVFFLIFILVLLAVVVFKLAKLKSVYFVTRFMSFVFIGLFVLSSMMNWDTIIGRYNFSKKEKSFIHLNYLATLSDSALPYLHVTLDELEKMDLKQEEQFDQTNFDSFSGSGSSFYRRTYMEPKVYHATIKERIHQFKRAWQKKGFLSWNYAEYVAYSKLKNH